MEKEIESGSTACWEDAVCLSVGCWVSLLTQSMRSWEEVAACSYAAMMNLVAHTHNSSTAESEAGGPEILDYRRLHSNTLP